VTSTAGIVVAYASHDGHTAAIAHRLAARSAAKGARAHDLESRTDAATVVSGCNLAVLVAAVRYGRHLAAADRFLAGYRHVDSPPPLAVASVNLTARKPAKSTPDRNPYLRKLIDRHRLQPVATAVFAGKLDYPRYRWVDRQMMRMIMAFSGGPTDGISVVDYTDWRAVDAFARELEIVLARQPEPTALV